MEVNPARNPIELFQEWQAEASRTETNDPDAAALATANEEGQPSVRMVLVKHADKEGFCFYTNMESRKGHELALNPQAALCFYWKSQKRQIRIEGRVERVSASMADTYFKIRHPLSQLSAWASKQSQPLENRAVLEKCVGEFEQKFQGQEIPRPPHWLGYRLVPEKIEFWQEGEGRLHDRFLFTRQGEEWTMVRLYP